MPLAPTIKSDPAEYARTHRYGTNHIVFSSNGARLATSDVRMNVEVMEAGDQIYHRNFESQNQKTGPGDRIRDIDMSPSGDRLYVAAGDTICAVDVATGEDLWSYTPPRSFGFLIISPTAMVADSKGNVVAAFNNGTIGLWSSDGKKRWLHHDNEAPRQLFMGRSGNAIIGTDSFSVCIWDLDTGMKVYRQKVEERIFGMAAHPDTSFIALRTLSQVELWNLDTNQKVLAVAAGPGLPLVAIHPNRPQFAFSSAHGVVIMDFRGDSKHHFSIDDAKVISLRFTPDGDQLVVGDSTEQLRHFTISS